MVLRRTATLLILALARLAAVDALRAQPAALHAAAAAAARGGRAAAPRLQTAPSATSATCKLHHAEAGSMLPSSELPLVILHGLFGAGANFQSWAKGLGDQDKSSSRRIVLVDLRNHGNSAHVPSMSYREMAADVIALLDELGVAECALCGHSLGGKVAMATALLHPTRIERLLVLDMAPALYERETCTAWAEIHEVVRALRGLDVAKLASKREAGALLEGPIPNGDMRAFALTNLVRAEGGGFRWRFNLPTIEASLAELAGWGDGLDELVYGRNTLFVGSNSRFLRSEHLPQMQTQFTCSSVTKVRDAGHWIHSDAPGPLQIVASNFLDVETDLCGACY